MSYKNNPNSVSLSLFNIRHSDSVIVSYMETVDSGESPARFTHWRVFIEGDTHFANTIDDVLDLIESNAYASPEDESLLDLGERLRTEADRFFYEIISEVQ